jgi:hypothetical protein
MHGGKRAGSGRKPIKIDLVELEKLCSLQCTDEEIAGFFGVSVRTIERKRKHEPAFAQAMNRGRAKGRISLRRSLFQQANQGKLPALTFMLGYSESRSDAAPKDSPTGCASPPKSKKKFEGELVELLELYREVTMQELTNEK